MEGAELTIDRNAPESAKRRGELDAGIPRATSLCGHEGGIVPSTSAMFGMPNIDGRPELPIDDNAPEPRNGEGSSTLNSEGKVLVRL
ncbi:hypothetical protein GmRootV116_22280 [Variovorax sp. V116]